MILLTMANILKKRTPVIVNVVDVREVAQAHIRSVTLERAKNQRFILAAEPIVYSDVMDMLDEEFKADYDLPSKEFYTLEEV